ncbi:zinc-ribbon domain-containing protein [Methanobrevibacter sp.]
MSKYCPKCGEELVDNAKFCKNCGTNLENMQNPEPTNNNFQVPVVEKDHTIAIIIGYILAVFMSLFGVVVAIYLMTRDSPKAKKHGKYVLILSIVLWVLSRLFLFRY